VELDKVLWQIRDLSFSYLSGLFGRTKDCISLRLQCLRDPNDDAHRRLTLEIGQIGSTTIDCPSAWHQSPSYPLLGAPTADVDRIWRTDDDHCLWSNRNCPVASLAQHQYRTPRAIRKRLQDLSERKTPDSSDRDRGCGSTADGAANPSERPAAGSDSASNGGSNGKGSDRKRRRISVEAEEVAPRDPKRRRVEESSEPPEEYCDPISFQLMGDPTLVTLTGITYERDTILQCIAEHGEDPFTRQKIDCGHLVPNRALKSAIDRWRKQHFEYTE